MGLKLDFNDIQICMLTHNEELLLEHTLKTMSRFFSNFAFLDQNSSDRTLDIIRDVLGERATLIVKPEEYIREVGFAAARNKLSDYCTKPWILHIDADEEVLIAGDQSAVTSETADANANFLAVARRNLGIHPNITLPLSPEKISLLPLQSQERHVRLYRNNVSIRWRSFIHEELWQGGQRAPHDCPECNLSLNHLSCLKGFVAAERKEEFYGWMLMRGGTSSNDEQETLSDYSLCILNERRSYFSKMAEIYDKKINK